DLYVALLLGELTALLLYCRKGNSGWLYLLALLNGLAMAVHTYAVIPLFCYAIFLVTLAIKKKVGPKNVLTIVMFWILGAAPLEFLVVKDLIQTADIRATFASLAFGHNYQHEVLNISITPAILKENLLYIMMNFPTPNILLLFCGLFALFRLAPSRSFGVILVALLILFLLFAFRYTIVDRYAFFIPFYTISAVLIGLGSHHLTRGANHKFITVLFFLFALFPVGAYAIAPSLARGVYPALDARRQIPYRDSYRYFLQPWRIGDTSAERFARGALERVERNAIIYADTTTVSPLLLLQEVEGVRPDVKIISLIASSPDAPAFNEQTIDQLLKETSVYVVSPIPGYCPLFLTDRFDFHQADPLWKVTARTIPQ
ncbi:MAG: hypothetical protein IID32_13000, partial [Planctomycetes bacterium]|nr:hypothetical protein [Planctomycetota bacterium]